MAARWRHRPYDPDRVLALAREAGVPPLIAQLLHNRGIRDADSARNFMEGRLLSLHDPETLPGVVEAADRVVRAVRNDKKIVIYGDYDVDGVCGSSLLWACLNLAGAKRVEYYIPHRVEEGYGVNADAIKHLVADRQADLIITVDCGISAVKEAELARELGVEFIITDHHTIGRDLPKADVLVHPRLEGSAYPFHDLCGCGVAFKLAWQICKSFGDGKKASPHLRDFLLQSMSLVALATVADVMPIVGENRLLVKHGLGSILKQPSVGLGALLEVCGLRHSTSLSTGNIGFGIAPRINAAGRLERAMMAVEMLTTDDLPRAREIASTLDACNTRRQEIEQTIVKEAREMIEARGGLGDRRAVVVGKSDWHSGVVGIVASRLVDFYHRPTAVVSLNDNGGLSQGSARSVPGFNLYDAIKECSTDLVAFGGHAAAAGLKLTRDRFDAFAERFEDHCRNTLTPEQLEKVLTIDAEVHLGALTVPLVEQIEKLEPYGIGNPRPILSASQVRMMTDPKLCGERKNHVQFRFAQGGVSAKAIGWNMAERVKKLAKGALCSIVFEPSINEWQGRRDVQLEIKDFRVEEEASDDRTA